MTEKEILIPARHQRIIELVSKNGYASIEEMSRKFDVTPQTIRRDINRLSELDQLKRFHGGVGLSSSVKNITYQARKALYSEEKAVIAELAVESIPDNASLFINIGTTTEEVARALSRRRKGLKVITNNLNVASILGVNEDFEVIIAGGMVRSRDFGITGEATVEFISQFKVDFGIIGVSGIDADGSLLDFDYHEVRVAKTIIANSRKTYLMTDRSKFGRSALVRLGTLSDIDAVFTDCPPPDEFHTAITEAGVDLFIAEKPPESSL
jgi:DeoR family transcriptional regulator, glycerol-3-phosphate regulon repressor